MTDKKEKGWIKFVPSLNLPKERVSIAYDTHDERGVRYAYGYFQFYNGTCGCFWKDGNEQPKVIKAEDIKYWMPVPYLDVQEEPVSEQNLSNVERVGKNWKEPVSDDFTKALAECIHQAQGSVVDPMVFAETWKDELIKLSKCEEPVSEDLEEAVNAYIGYAPEVDESSSTYGKRQAFKAGANWKEQQFEKNRLKHCNSITNEQAELEQGFTDQHLNKYNRMPTFLDAIEYGMRLQKEQLMKEAISGHVGQTINGMLRALSDETFGDMGFMAGDKVKLIIIKEDCI